MLFRQGRGLHIPSEDTHRRAMHHPGPRPPCLWRGIKVTCGRGGGKKWQDSHRHPGSTIPQRGAGLGSVHHNCSHIGPGQHKRPQGRRKRGESGCDTTKSNWPSMGSAAADMGGRPLSGPLLCPDSSGRSKEGWDQEADAEAGGLQSICTATARPQGARKRQTTDEGGGAVGTRPQYSVVCLLAAPIGPSPLLIVTLCGPERVWVVSTEPPDDLSCLTTPGVGGPGDGASARADKWGRGGDWTQGDRGLTGWAVLS